MLSISYYNHFDYMMRKSKETFYLGEKNELKRRSKKISVFGYI